MGTLTARTQRDVEIDRAIAKRCPKKPMKSTISGIIGGTKYEMPPAMLDTSRGPTWKVRTPMQPQCTIPTPKKNTYCPVDLSEQYAGTDTVVIPLSSGAHALVDEADFPLVAGFHWHENHKGRRTSYAYSAKRINGVRHQYIMHRMILSTPKGMVVDHINRNGLDNRRCNLRVLTPTQNLSNSAPFRGSRYKGVYKCVHTGRWIAKIYGNGKHHWLGRHDTEVEAARAYDKAAIRVHGQHAYLNFPNEGGK